MWIPHQARSAVAYGILVDVFSLKGLGGQGLVFLGITFGSGLMGATRCLEIFVLVALYSIGCRSFRAMIQVMRISWRTGNAAAAGASLLLAGLSIAYGSLPSWLQAVLPQHAIMLISRPGSGQMLSVVLVALAAYLVIILCAILLILNRADIPMALGDRGKTVGRLLQLAGRIVPGRVRRMTEVCTKNGAFRNLMLHGIKCCLYDVRGIRGFLLEAMIMVVLLVYLKSQHNAIPVTQMLVCCLLFGLPGYRFAGALLSGLKGIFWLVKISHYSCEMAVLAYGCGGYMWSCLACLVLALALKICGVFEFAAVFFVPWVCFAFLPGVVLFALRSHAGLLLSHALSTPIPLMVEAVRSRVAYLVLVVFPSVLGACLLAAYRLDSYYWMNILLGAFWYNVFLGYYMLRKTIRILTAEAGMIA